MSNNVFLIEAKNKNEALLKFKELSPSFSNITINDIREIDENNNYITVYRIPKNTNKDLRAKHNRDNKYNRYSREQYCSRN